LNAGNFNSKALNTIFKGVSLEEFRRISLIVLRRYGYRTYVLQLI